MSDLAVVPSANLVKAADGTFRPQRVVIAIQRSEIDNIQGNLFISADAYCRIAQGAAISFRVANVEKRYDGRGGLSAVSMRMQAMYRNPTGEIQLAEEEMELRVDELLEENRSKAAKKLGITGTPVYDAEGRLVRVTVKLPPEKEIDLYEDSMRTRMFLDRKLTTRLKARLTKGLTGVTPKSLPAPDRDGIRKITVIRMLPADIAVADSTELYPEPGDDDEIDAQYEAKPGGADMPPHDHSREESAPPESPSASPDSQRNPKAEDRSRCSDCGKVLSDKTFQYFQEHPTYTPRCFDCNQKRKTANGNGRSW